MIFRVSPYSERMASTMGFTGMAELTHDMESLLDEIRKQSIKVNTGIIDLLFECLDGLQAYANNIAQDGVEGDVDNRSLIKRLGMVLGRTERKTVLKGGHSQTDIEFNDHEAVVMDKAAGRGSAA